VGAGVIYVGLGLVWVLNARASAWLVAWFVAVAVVGAFVPGEANQVSLARAYLAGPAFMYALDGQFAALAVTVAIAGLTDLVDGTIARRFERPSNLAAVWIPSSTDSSQVPSASGLPSAARSRCGLGW